MVIDIAWQNSKVMMMLLHAAAVDNAPMLIMLLNREREWDEGEDIPLHYDTTVKCCHTSFYIC